MTKKDYVLIAEAIKRAKNHTIGKDEEMGALLVQQTITEALIKANPKFNEFKFEKACQL